MVSGLEFEAEVLEPAFAASEAAAAPLGFGRSAAEVHSATPGGRAIVHERLGRTWRAISSLADPKVASVQFLSVQFFDSRGHGGAIIELDEREAARSVGGPVDGKKDLFDCPRFREERLQVSLRCFVAKVPDEYSRRNGVPPFVISRSASSGSRPTFGQHDHAVGTVSSPYRHWVGNARRWVSADRVRHATPKRAPWAQHTPTVWETQS